MATNTPTPPRDSRRTARQARPDETTTTTATTTTAAVDAEQRVWTVPGRDCYHADQHGIVACPELLEEAEATTLRAAADAGHRPCPQCSPTDHRHHDLRRAEGKDRI